MLDIILDYIKKILKSRLFPITIVYVVLFSLVIHRLFVLQIVQGETHADNSEFKDIKNREIKSTRGNIYDRNGKLLATNMLSYSIVMDDSTEINSLNEKNAMIYRLIHIIEGNGDTLDTDFYIRQNNQGDLEFTIDGAALTRFKKNAFTYVLDKKKELTEEQKNATPQQVYDFLKNGTGDNYTHMFGISDEYSVEDTLKIMSVRYALFCNYPKYVQIAIASNVSDTTVAAIMENSALLPGVEVQQQTHRVYNNSIYFAHILGYTGSISSDELDELNKDSDYYNSTDIIGKSGLEQKYESYLGGKKGSEIVTVNNSGKKVGVLDRIDPVAGDDVYLTIDSDLQIASYHVLEKKIAGILLQKIVPDMNYGSKGENAADITIPIYEVYNALLNNSIVDINHFTASDASALEKQVYKKYQDNLERIFSELDTLLSLENKVTNDKAGTMEEYLSYFYTVLVKQNILMKSAIPSDDPTLLSYTSNKTSLNSFIQYAIAKNWIDLSKLSVGDEYYSAEELYGKLIKYMKNILKEDSIFNKKIYRDLVFSYKLSGSEICLLLFDQGVLKYNEDEINRLKNGNISPYQFLTDKIKTLDITPAMLALEPCSGSLVVTDVNTGEVRALVTYPSYDNNKLANKIDPDYWKKLNNDLSYPLMNRPVQQRTAPGSTFKMVTSFAALQENVVGPEDTVLDLGEFKKIKPSAKCHIFPGSHGSVNLSEALEVSCNYYFYEMGWRLSVDSTGRFQEQLGLDRLKEYATLFGLDQKSGLELYEVSPEISNDDSVRSAIGQGTNVYTPAQLSRYVTTLANNGTCYNLTLLSKIVDKDGNVAVSNKPAVLHELKDIKQSTWDSVHDGLYDVVNNPKGSVYNLFRNFGVTVAGKTGTSQISKVKPNNALFVSYAPYNNPEISITAVIPNGYTSTNAADLSKDIYKLYFHLQDSQDIINGEVITPDASVDAHIE